MNDRLRQKRMFNMNTLGFIFLVSGSLVLSACTSVNNTAAGNCSCVNYMSEKPQPDWVFVENTSGSEYKSQGISECSGLQTLDFKEADLNARANLSRMLESSVESEVVLQRDDYGNGTGKSSGLITSSQNTKMLLRKSSIYDRWIDLKACTIHSAVKISKADIQLALKQEKEKYNKALRNQRFVIVTNGEYKSELTLAMAEMLSQSGVTKLLKSPVENTYKLNAALENVDVLNNGLLVRVSIGLNVQTPEGSIVWSKLISGKGLSFGQSDQSQLTRVAIQQAGKNAKTVFEQMLDQNEK